MKQEKIWNGIGFTEGLESPIKELCESAFDDLAKEFLQNKEMTQEESMLATLMFPATRRAIEETGKYSSDSFREVLRNLDCKKIYNKFVGDLINYCNIDVEAEFCVLLSRALSDVMRGDLAPTEFGDVLCKLIEKEKDKQGN
jgi:hypothetical protein